MKSIRVLIVLALASCVRNPSPYAVPVGDDKSIIFPQFFQSAAVVMDEPGKAYVLKGAALRAMMIASQDFFPSQSEAQPCWEKQEAHNYRVIAQGEIIFVSIYLDPESCGRRAMALDSGVKYAISTDGRILRRVFEGEPEGPPSTVSPDAGTRRLFDEPDFSEVFKGPANPPSGGLPSKGANGGAGTDGGSPGARDGGS